MIFILINKFIQWISTLIFPNLVDLTLNFNSVNVFFHLHNVKYSTYMVTILIL